MIRRFAGAAHAAGHSPERTLGALKAIAVEVCPARVDRQRVEEIGERILRVCLVEYFDRRPPEATPPA